MNIIRKGVRILLTLVLAGAAFSCDILDFDAFRTPETLVITPSTQNPDAMQKYIGVNVTCDLKWQAELSNTEWARIENVIIGKDNSGSFSLILSPNTGKEARKLTITVKAGKGSATMDITQGGTDTYFNPTSLTLTGVVTSKASFKAPGEWTAQVVSGKDWLALDVASGHAGDTYVSCHAKDPNENIGSRSGMIKVTFDGVSVDLPVVQNQTDVILSDNSQTMVDWKGGEFTVNTRTNVQYTIECPADWVRHTATKALNEATEAFTVETNDNIAERSATITFTGGGASYTLTVVQEGKDPFLNVFLPGFYGIDGKDYILGNEGWNQSGRKTSRTGAVELRLMNRASLSVISVSGIKPDAQEGSSATVTVVMKTGFDETMRKSYNCIVLGSSDGLLWLKAQPETCFIVKK